MKLPHSNSTLLPATLLTLGVAMACGTVGAQQAPAPQRLGKVHFKVECSAEAQREFNRAMSYYHSFAWRELGEPLNRALQADPGCGMAHWARLLGALDNPFTWPGSISAKTLSEGAAHLDAARAAGLRSQRERDYVDALAAFFRDADKLDHRTRAKALEDALEQLALRYPDDTEAAVLYALVLSANFDPADKKYGKQLKAASILEPIFQAQPEHPGVAHYLIHSYDYPPIAGQGVEAARRYSRIAADAPHALHMPSHIFTRVGAWRDSIETNAASARADRGATFNTLHAYDYMVYAHMQLGQPQAAERVREDAWKLPSRIDHFGAAYAYAAMPARIVLERGAWAEAAALELLPGGDYPWQKYPQAEAVNAFARGIGAARAGDAARAAAEVARLHRLRDAATAMKIGYWADQIDIQAAVVQGLARSAAGERARGIDELRQAAQREDATEKHVITPGPILPARELLASLLLESGRAAEALPEFEAVLRKEPNRLRALAGATLAAERAGDRTKAREWAARLLELTAGADQPLAEVQQARRVLASN